MYILDNNALQDFTYGNPNMVRRVAEYLPLTFLSTIVMEELLVGIMSSIVRARSPRNGLSLVKAHQNFAEALESVNAFEVLIYSDEAAAVFSTFPPSILHIGQQDCRIAAQAMAHGMTVVTRNVRDFKAIGAPCEDWSPP